MGQTIGLKASDGFLLGGYRADPQGKPKGGLVVIQEIFGVNHHIRNVCDRFAALGYAAVAPAMFDRAKADVDLGYDKAGIDEGVKLRAAIKLEDSLKDVQASIDAAKSAGKVGVVGYCWGGSLAFLAAARLSGLACAVGYYGGMIAAHKDEKPKVPTILHFGEQDNGIPMSDVETIKAARPELKIYTYAAGHGFSCDERGSFDAASHEQALKVTLAFFKENLEN
ncbi:dienelactone hydrolase family protein [Dongia sedimenti]|uniref:Dienelactone hydrolase family protein n=1 Tax=Dongia sedimenti TaxID=3064282 RepID=A0ABU0YFW2_9PROT|nr:dienelactone hydrolase family protein [Rhodospirillaceae bacterium R-7]